MFPWLRPALATALAVMVAGGLPRMTGRGAPAPYRPPVEVSADPPAYYASDLFEPMPPPGPGDWMAVHPEPPQSFAAYVRSRPIRPTRQRHTLVVSAVGPMEADQRARLAVLRDFLGRFYGLPAREGPTLGLEGVRRRRRSFFGRDLVQYRTGDLLEKVLAPALPPDAVCLLGVCMVDLYPQESWNYVFGQASLRARVGIYSLLRFQPTFWGDRPTAQTDRLALVRSLKTLVHETGHMFGLRHCQRFQCVMNGSNSLAESDRRPLHLCPDCLRKLRWNLGLDVVARYEALAEFYRRHGLGAEAEWVARRLRQCRGAGEP